MLERAAQELAPFLDEVAFENGNLRWPQSGGLIWPHPVTVDVSV